ncbi:hypothetical protein F9B85_06445 [Heliorestis acidaminivorans]|uniref:DUF4177 domain-containing protein n=1 Tax=Heliorestis acidaminivorans TaxID=553427 RepID=A0A6I0ESN0_9FIRM|nr:hypothetical protein [Heliorestis acidaminivorans]KAB2952908.1 hypothetical protein F9B85_06445 [Heliorestis acidaminivorans]
MSMETKPIKESLPRLSFIKSLRRKKMKKFEYKCVFILGLGERTTRILNEYGQSGWELVATSWVWHYFKREIN